MTWRQVELKERRVMLEGDIKGDGKDRRA
jgi:hypothetical protein